MKVGFMMNDKIETQALQAHAEQLERKIEEQKQIKEELKTELASLEREYRKGRWIVDAIQHTKRDGIANIRNVARVLLGRKTPKALFSKTYKRKDASNQLKKYKSYLYNQGFEERVLTDLQSLFHNTSNKYLRRAIAWELSLWYANKLHKKDAEMTLFYLDIALANETREDMLRRGAILRAEALGLLGKVDEGKKVIEEALTKGAHPDLYLALANLEETIIKRIDAINQSLRMYKLAPITLSDEEEKSFYERLTVNTPLQQVTEGPTVTIIIPTYNAEDAIVFVIDSLLKQTYKNIEIIAVDDCSTDGTVQEIEKYAAKDPRVKLLTTPENSGPYVARNIALNEARGELVTINDADDWSHPEKIEKQVKDFFKHPDRIANMSENARMTEQLKLYRRGMPGQYIFTNMSSLMFKKKEVIEKIGYWDSVRFAADSEFIKRMIQTFGKDKIAYLKTGPLSFPMQSSSSLTGNSAFGYDGFLKGIRKEYTESQQFFHKKAKKLYIPFPQEKRAFPVPEPMWPKREVRKGEKRKFPFVIAADFRKKLPSPLAQFIEHLRKKKVKVGLVQMGVYDFNIRPKIHDSVRELIDGSAVQMLVYGEKVICNILIVANPAVFQEKQKYIPHLHAQAIHVIVPYCPRDKEVTYELRRCAREIEAYGKTTSTWFPINDDVRKKLEQDYKKELRSIRLAKQNWLNRLDGTEVATYLDDWIIESIPL